MTDVKKSLLEEAERIINGHRRNTYGKPEQNFERIAALWNTYLDIKDLSEDGQYISPRDVPIMMNLMKIARLVETPDHRDSIVDMIGYAACYGELVLAKEQTLAEYTNEAMDEIIAKIKAEAPIVPRSDPTRQAFLESAKIGDEVQYWKVAEGTLSHVLEVGRVTDIDDFHAWVRLKINGDWVNNERIVAIIPNG